MKYIITLSLLALASSSFSQKIAYQTDSTKNENNSLLPIQPVNFNAPLYFIDNKEISAADVQKINPEQITVINIFKGSSAIAKYGQGGRNGVVVLKLRDNSKPAINRKRSLSN